MDFLLQVAKKSPDDSGYVKSWDGVGKRLTDEMYSCFKYDKKGIHIGTEMEELKARIEVLAQVICTFGEYLSVTDRYPIIALAHPSPDSIIQGDLHQCTPETHHG